MTPPSILRFFPETIYQNPLPSKVQLIVGQLIFMAFSFRDSFRQGSSPHKEQYLELAELLPSGLKYWQRSAVWIIPTRCGQSPARDFRVR